MESEQHIPQIDMQHTDLPILPEIESYEADSHEADSQSLSTDSESSYNEPTSSTFDEDSNTYNDPSEGSHGSDGSDESGSISTCEEGALSEAQSWCEIHMCAVAACNQGERPSRDSDEINPNPRRGHDQSEGSNSIERVRKGQTGPRKITVSSKHTCATNVVPAFPKFTGKKNYLEELAKCESAEEELKEFCGKYRRYVKKSNIRRFFKVINIPGHINRLVCEARFRSKLREFRQGYRFFYFDTAGNHVIP